jgi:hypothetical protein
MMTVTQTTRLLAWLIVGLIAAGMLLHFFGPAAMEREEIIVIGLLVLGLIVFLIRLRWREIVNI